MNELLFSAPVFSTVTENMREDFFSRLDFKTKTFESGDSLFTQGESVTFLPVLTKGVVRTEMFSASGSVLQIDVISAPQILAPSCAFATSNRIPVSVTALEQSELVKISVGSLQDLFPKYPMFFNALLTHISDRIHFLTDRLNFQNIKTIKGKLAQYILDHSNNTSFTFAMNQTELSNYFGVERSSLARSLSEIIQDNIITIKKNKGEILNINQLKALLY